MSQVAYHMLTFALILHIYDLTKSLTTISLVMMATAIPSVVFGPFSGAFTDKIRYKTVLFYTNILRFLVVILLIPAAHNTLAILELIFLMSTITQFFSPAELSSIPLIVKKEDLIATNSIYMTTMYASLMVGYGAAGPLQALVGSQIMFIIIASFYLIAAIAIRTMSNYDLKEKAHDLTLSNLAKSISSIWETTKDGIKYIRSKKNISSSMFKLAIGWAILGAFIVILPGFTEKVMRISTRMGGILLIVPAGFGMLVASYFLSKKNQLKKNVEIYLGFIICGLALFLLSAYSLYRFLDFSIVVAVILMIVMGFATALVYVPAQTLLHQYSDENMRGRVFGINAMLINLAMSTPALFVGGIADLTSPTFALVLVALIIIFFGISLYFEEE